MQYQPILRSAVVYVEIHEDDYSELQLQLQSQPLPEWLPAGYAVEDIELTGFCPKVNSRLVRIKLIPVTQRRLSHSF